MYVKEYIRELVIQAYNDLTVRDTNLVSEGSNKGLIFGVKNWSGIKAIVNVVLIALTALVNLENPLPAVNSKSFNSYLPEAIHLRNINRARYGF